MGRQRVMLLEAFNRDTGMEELLGFSDRGGFMTAPSDTPPNTFYPGRIKQALNFEVSLFEGRTWWGRSKIGQGRAVLANPDGKLDWMERYSFDGRAWRILEGDENGSLADMQPIFTGVMAPHTMAMREVVLTLRDRFALLDKPVCGNVYAGTNSGPSGVEGGESLKGKRKRVVFGPAKNVRAEIVNESSLMLQFSDGALQAVSNPRHNGAPWAMGADFATRALLEAATVPAATVATCLAEGYGKAGSRITGTLTADVQGKAGAVYRDTLAGLLWHLFIAGAIPEADLLEETFATLDAARPAKVDLVVEGDETYLSAADRLCASGLAWFTHEEFGKVYVGRLGLPAGPAVDTIEDVLRSDPLERMPHQVTEDGMPAWRVTVKWGENHTVQDKNSLAGSITGDAAQAALVEWLGTRWRTALAEDPSVRVAYPNAKEIEIETRLTSQADADALAAEILTMFSVPRYFWKAKVPPGQLVGVQLGKVVTFKYRRFDLNAGKLFTATGLARDLGRRFGRIVMWG